MNECYDKQEKKKERIICTLKKLAKIKRREIKGFWRNWEME